MNERLKRDWGRVCRQLFDGEFAITTRTGHWRTLYLVVEVTKQPDGWGISNCKREGVRDPVGELVAETLAQRAIWIEPNNMTQVPLDVLVVIRPRLLSRAPPCSYPINVLGDPLSSSLRFPGARLCGKVLDILKKRLKLALVLEEHFIQFVQSGRSLFKELLAGPHGSKPVLL